MRAVDTNIIVRYLARDDAEQFALAKAVLTSGPVFIGVTVVLETCWVIERVYGRSVADTVALVRAVLGLPSMIVEDAVSVANALAWAEAGLDIADAIHLARSADCADFATFDATLAKRSKDLSAVPVVLLDGGVGSSVP